MTGADPTRAARLAVEAADAARIRALATDPDVIALRVERVRGQVDACAWLAIGLGLAFTAVNVQTFAAAGAAVWSPAWLVAWLLDPMVSLLLVAVLRAEQVTARWQVPTGPRVVAAKWGAFAATYAMNTWVAWTWGAPSGVVLHSVPPLVVLLGAEVAPELRDRLTAAVHAAASAPSVGRLPAARTGQVRTAALAGPGLDLPAAVAPTGAAGQDRSVASAVSPAAGPRSGPENPVGKEPGEVGEIDEPGSEDPVGVEAALTAAEVGCLLGVTEDEVLTRQRAGALTARPRGADLTGDAGTGEAGADAGTAAVGDSEPGDVGDVRVGELVELLAAGCPVTGSQAAALHEVSERQGRRLLADARAHRDSDTPANPTVTGTTVPRPGLHLVDLPTAGGHS